MITHCDYYVWKYVCLAKRAGNTYLHSRIRDECFEEWVRRMVQHFRYVKEHLWVPRKEAAKRPVWMKGHGWGGMTWNDDGKREIKHTPSIVRSGEELSFICAAVARSWRISFRVVWSFIVKNYSAAPRTNQNGATNETRWETVSVVWSRCWWIVWVK